MPDIRFVRPGTLRLPPEREDGPDQFKLAAQVMEFGEIFDGMPPLLVIEGANGELQVYDGVTRATRAHTMNPFMYVLVEVTQVLPEWNFESVPTVANAAQIDF
jgi:hypothetical protein